LNSRIPSGIKISFGNYANLRINKLSLDTTEVIVEGKIFSLSYSEKNADKNSAGSFLGKIFK